MCSYFFYSLLEHMTMKKWRLNSHHSLTDGLLQFYKQVWSLYSICRRLDLTFKTVSKGKSVLQYHHIYIIYGECYQRHHVETPRLVQTFEKHQLIQLVGCSMNKQWLNVSAALSPSCLFFPLPVLCGSLCGTGYCCCWRKMPTCKNMGSCPWKLFRKGAGTSKRHLAGDWMNPNLHQNTLLAASSSFQYAE